MSLLFHGAPGRASDRRITEAVLDRQTADLTLRFGSAVRVDVFNCSAAHEGWQAAFVDDDGCWSLIALGGGDVAFMPG